MTMTTHDANHWDADDFEDTVAAALIACFETKIRKWRFTFNGNSPQPSDRITDERAALMRASGPYIVSPSRVFFGSLPDKHWSFDLINDPLPVSGCSALPAAQVLDPRPDGYLYMNYVRRASALGKHWHTRRAGTLFEMLSTWACNGGLLGQRTFFTVTKTGETWACLQVLQDAYGRKWATLDEFLRGIEEEAMRALQMLADRRFCWTITAQEKTARAHLGCMREEIKSLLYARDLPMTATGRKRPILHLIEAHKRRLRNGTDIDITAFLRGQQVVEIGGTAFQVNPPRTLYPAVSDASRKRYFDPSIA